MCVYAGWPMLYVCFYNEGLTGYFIVREIESMKRRECNFNQRDLFQSEIYIISTFIYKSV